MGALALKVLMAAGILTAGVGAGVTMADRQGEFAHRLEALARDTVDDVDRQLSGSPWRVVEGVAIQEGNTVQELQLTVRARDATGAEVSGLAVVVRTPQATLTLPSGAAPAPTVTSVRDADGSVARGRVDEVDLARITVPLEALADDLRPRSSFTLVLHAAGANPVTYDVELPIHFEGRYVGLELRERS